MPRKIGEPGEPGSDQEVELTQEEKESLEKMSVHELVERLEHIFNEREYKLMKAVNSSNPSKLFDAGQANKIISEATVEKQRVSDEIQRRIDSREIIK